jgi:hypothetical protein
VKPIETITIIAAMKPVEIIILIAAIALVAFSVIYNIRKRKKGKGCGCADGGDSGGCSGCSGCSVCATEESKSISEESKGDNASGSGNE